jgi:hypothetical protein
MKNLFLLCILLVSFNLFSQSGGLGGAPVDPTTNPTGTGFGGTASPSGTIPGSGVNTLPPTTGSPSDLDQERMEDTSINNVPTTVGPNQTPPGYPSNVPGTAPGTTIPSNVPPTSGPGTGLPTGSGTGVGTGMGTGTSP